MPTWPTCGCWRTTRSARWSARHRAGCIPADVIKAHLPPGAIDHLRALFRAQTSQVINDLVSGDTGQMPPQLRQTLREAGVTAQLMTPFGVGGELLGIIVLQRMQAGRPWTPAEVDAMESVAADLGRGLNHARLDEAENRLVGDLKALDTAKSTFFATVSHELRAPLTTIEGYVEMFGDGDAGEVTSQQRQMLEAIDRSTVRLRNLVDDVFTLAKLESGAFTTVMRPVDLTDVIRAAADAVRPSVIAGELDLTISATEGELMVDGDASQLDRVVINLLSNAVKFTPKGGRVDVSAFAEGRSAVIRVRDTGIGIPASDQKELFNRFFRASNATGRSIPRHRAGAGHRPDDRGQPWRRHQADVRRGRRDQGDRLASDAAPGDALVSGHQGGDGGAQRAEPAGRGGAGLRE